MGGISAEVIAAIFEKAADDMVRNRVVKLFDAAGPIASPRWPRSAAPRRVSVILPPIWHHALPL